MYLGSDTAIEIPMASKERKIEALMVILERSGRTICLKSNAFSQSIREAFKKKKPNFF